MAVSLFRYLGKMLSSTADDWPAVECNLRKAQGKWVWLAKKLVRDGVEKRTTGRFYVAVVQSVLLFGFEKWFLTSRLEKSLKGFHYWATQQMAVMVPKY